MQPNSQAESEGQVRHVHPGEYIWGERQNVQDILRHDQRWRRMDPCGRSPVWPEREKIMELQRGIEPESERQENRPLAPVQGTDCGGGTLQQGSVREKTHKSKKTGHWHLSKEQIA